MEPSAEAQIHRSADPPKRHERAVGQAAGPISNRKDICKPPGTPPGMRRTIRRSAASERSGMTPGPSRIESSAEAETHRSDTSEPLGKPPGLYRIETIYASHRARRRASVEPSAEAPRASHRARLRARLDPNYPPKRYTSEPSGKPQGPSQIMRYRASRIAHRAVHRAIR